MTIEPNKPDLKARPDKFDFALLTANLFMANVPCDSSYDKKMGELLVNVKKAHLEAQQSLIGQLLEDLVKNRTSHPILQVTVKDGKSVSSVLDVVDVPTDKAITKLRKATNG